MDDNHRFLYALAAGWTISGFLLWVTVWHTVVLKGMALGLVVFVAYWFRYGGAREWDRVRRHGTPHEVHRFQAVVTSIALFLIILSVFAQTR
jgi:uncharacterized membrane protein